MYCAVLILETSAKFHLATAVCGLGVFVGMVRGSWRLTTIEGQTGLGGSSWHSLNSPPDPVSCPNRVRMAML